MDLVRRLYMNDWTNTETRGKKTVETHGKNYYINGREATKEQYDAALNQAALRTVFTFSSDAGHVHGDPDAKTNTRSFSEFHRQYVPLPFNKGVFSRFLGKTQ